MDMSVVAVNPPLLSIGILLSIAIVWIGPIGLFVLRKHLAEASGGRLLVKGLLTTLTVLTAPGAVLTLFVMVAGGVEAMDLLWWLLKSTW